MTLSEEEKKLAAEMLPNAGELRHKVHTRTKAKRDEAMHQYLQHVTEKIDEAVAKDQLTAEVHIPFDLVDAISSMLDAQGFVCHAAPYARANPPERQLVTIKWENAELPPEAEPRPAKKKTRDCEGC